jgi:hypothetical protein
MNSAYPPVAIRKMPAQKSLLLSSPGCIRCPAVAARFRRAIQLCAILVVGTAVLPL